MAPAATRSNFPSSKLKAITAAPGLLDPRPRALYVSEDTSLSLQDEDGITGEEGIPVLAGSILPVSPARVTAGTGIYGFFD